ncbi:hypothetical protein F4860DRAFT_523614 [Xylaria cubensis]|nr:hypothetical protein F4860DRAFT_523614 [Xylaria cubensis]
MDHSTWDPILLKGPVVDNAVLELPPDATWDYIANITGDESWAASKMRKIFEEIKNSHYIGINPAATMILQAMLELGAPGNMSVEDLRDQLSHDINALNLEGDQATGVFGIVTHANAEERRFSPANYVRRALSEVPDLPLFIEPNSTFTRIAWDPLSPAPYSFEGYGLEFPDNYGANTFTIAFALENPRGSQETVALRSANSLDPSGVNFLIFEKGPDQDLQAMLEAGSKLRGEHEDADW